MRSNAESGDGYSDILIEIESISMGIVIELKYSESRDLETACLQALEQIEEKNSEQVRKENIFHPDPACGDHLRVRVESPESFQAAELLNPGFFIDILMRPLYNDTMWKGTERRDKR